MKKLLFCLLLATIQYACAPQKKDNKTTNTPYEKPNILWITCEDIGPQIGCYGDSIALTPNIDQLASEGIRFTNAYSVSGVCSPSRSAIAMGMYPTSIGTHHMRTGGLPQYLPPAIVPYEAVPPPNAKIFTEYLRAAGYYCTNNAKEDYQVGSPMTAWDDSGYEAHWRNRPEGKPFFSVFNSMLTHESRIWQRAKEPLRVDPEDVIVPPYYPDTDTVRRDLAINYSNIAAMDDWVGDILKQLKEDDLLDNTIIFFFSDHGGPLPRQKRALYDSGLKIPLIVRFPQKQQMNTTFSDLVNFVDFAPTVLSLANIAIPDYLQGQAFLGEQSKKEPRQYTYAAADRFDTEYDMARAIRNKRFKYIKNYQPDKPFVMDLAFRKNIPMMRELLKLDSLGELKGIPALWFAKTKPKEELYDTEVDPYEVHNLAGVDKYKNDLVQFREELKKWQDTYGDLGLVSEEETLQKMWPELKQPETKSPQIKLKNNEASITCETNGASVSYKINDTNWQLYTEPVVLQRRDSLQAIAIRYGYKHSKPSRVFAN